MVGVRKDYLLHFIDFSTGTLQEVSTSSQEGKGGARVGGVRVGGVRVGGKREGPIEKRS